MTVNGRCWEQGNLNVKTLLIGNNYIIYEGDTDNIVTGLQNPIQLLASNFLNAQDIIGVPGVFKMYVSGPVFPGWGAWAQGECTPCCEIRTQS